MQKQRHPTLHPQHHAKKVPVSSVILTVLTVFLVLLVLLVTWVNLFVMHSPPTTQEPTSKECEPKTNTVITSPSAPVLQLATSSAAMPPPTDEVMNDSTNATVMGMATGYNVGVYKRFVGSLRNSGYKGHIILVISDKPARGVVDYLSSRGVTMKTLKTVPCTTQIFAEGEKVSGHAKEVATCADPYPYLKIRWGRFPLLRDYLQECETCTGPVLVTDVRDALFQRDPFGDGAPLVKGLQVFQEAKFQKTTHWLVKGPVSKCKGLVIDDIMLCSGTTIGTREAMLEYLQIMHDEMAEWMKDPKCCCNKMNGDDQSIHNYLYYTGRFPNATSIPNRFGIVHTVGKQAAEIYKAHEQNLKRSRGDKDLAKSVPLPGTKEGENPWLGPEFDLVDNEGFFIDYDGGRSRVVHQWDRFRDKIQPWLKTNGLTDP